MDCTWQRDGEPGLGCGAPPMGMDRCTSPSSSWIDTLPPTSFGVLSILYVTILIQRSNPHIPFDNLCHSPYNKKAPLAQREMNVPRRIYENV